LDQDFESIDRLDEAGRDTAGNPADGEGRDILEQRGLFWQFLLILLRHNLK